jgi:alkaline phosphatase
MKITKLISIFLVFLFIVACSSKKPKNVIIMISDGAGFNHILATDYYQYGQSGKQVYQNFPVKLAMATYSLDAEGYDSDLAWNDSLYIDSKWTDSAASASALSTGYKTINGYLGVNAQKEKLEHFSEFIHGKGKKIGTVTTVVACHGTPAGFTIHSPFRKNYPDIFQSMILDSKLSVMFGAGLDESDNLPDHKKYYYVGNKAFWKQLEAGNTAYDLDGDWQVDKSVADIDGDGQPDPWQIIRNKDEFLNITKDNAPKRLLGIFKSRANAQYDRKGDKHLPPFQIPLRENIPSLSEMSSAALNILDNDQGFWLLIEGGAVDKASHANWKGRTIEEQIDFNHAVEKTVEWIENNSSWDETLLIVTADHETGHISGQANMLQEIVAPIKQSSAGLMPEFYFLSSEHTNSLVPFFAKGVGSDTFIERADKEDKVRGKYLHSTDVAKSLFDLFQD